jgi:hypothetical protein
LFVAGPQVGYFFPEILLELDLHGGGLDARGASFPGLSAYVLLGRAKTSRGARRPRTPTSSITSSRRCAATTCTTGSAVSARR